MAMRDMPAWRDFDTHLEHFCEQIERRILLGKEDEAKLRGLREALFILQNVRAIPEEVDALRRRAEEFQGL